MTQKIFKYTNPSRMNLKEMGSRYPSRLSFSRSMLRTLVKEKWKINEEISKRYFKNFL